MNRRDFLKFAPIIPVAAGAAAYANMNPPSVLTLPITFEGTDGNQLQIRQVGDSIAIFREGQPDNQTAINITKPVETNITLQPGVNVPWKNKHDINFVPTVYKYG